MSYIGKEPQTGAFSMLDALTASATASYSLTLDSVAFVPESANHLLVSLNGSIQKAGSSYTVSGSTLTFSSTLASSDSIDFVLALGNVLDIGTPSDATVTNAKTNFVSTSSAAGLQIKGDGTTDGTLQLNCSQNSHGIKLKSPAHSTSSSYTLTFPGTDPSADKFLKTDGSGNLSFADAGGGITVVDEWYKTSGESVSSGSSTITSNWARNAQVPPFGQVGTGMSESSGIFTFPQTGVYFILGQIYWELSNSADRLGLVLKISTNSGGAYDTHSAADHSISANGHKTTVQTSAIIDVTDASTFRLKMDYYLSSGSGTINGNAAVGYTFLQFIRLADT
tara:strand:- start:528 stop:1538 length:1011 start_codon:yes stop_codon:yes gene_type:complete